MVLTISMAVIALIIVLGGIFMIPIALQIYRTAREAEKLLSLMQTHMVPLAQGLGSLVGHANGILESVQRQVDKMEEGIFAVRNTLVRVREFEETIFRPLEESVLELTALVTTATRGLDSLFRLMRR